MNANEHHVNAGRWRLVCIAAIAMVAVSCDRKREPGFPIPRVQAAATPSVESAVVPPAVEAAIRANGQAITAQAFGVLSSRLGKAIADAGFTNAISFCSVHGLNLTTSVGVTNEVVLRRVTHRPRNPANRADTNELAIIQQMQREVDRGHTPDALVAANRPEVFTYYSPIVLSLPLCLNCHGEPDTGISSANLKHLKELYPADEATGFKLGQVRGLWSIDFKRSDFAGE
jgi:hypothetical protein